MLVIQNNITMFTIFDIHTVEELFSKRDGVPIKYVCSTGFGEEIYSSDIFFRETPHPEFGNRYFRLIRHGESVYVGNADAVEDLNIIAIKKGETWLFSQHRHHFVEGDGGCIDGGRAYTRIIGNPETTLLKVKDGEINFENA